MKYLQAVARVAPEVLESLRDEVWLQRGTGDAFRERLQEWADTYRLRDRWLLEAAIYTLEAWKEYGVPESPYWGPEPISASIEFPPPAMVPFRFSGFWRPGESSQQMASRLRREFDHRLGSYLEEVQERVQLRDGAPERHRRGRKDRDPDTYREWCALHQCCWLRYDQIAQIDEVTSNNVGRRIREVAGEIGLTLPGRGSGPRDWRSRNRREKRP